MPHLEIITFKNTPSIFRKSLIFQHFCLLSIRKVLINSCRGHRNPEEKALVIKAFLFFVPNNYKSFLSLSNPSFTLSNFIIQLDTYAFNGLPFYHNYSHGNECQIIVLHDWGICVYRWLRKENPLLQLEKLM